MPLFVPVSDISAKRLFQYLNTVADGDATHTTDRGLDYITGNFWTSGQRQGHSIHEISYRACFKPHLPELLIRLLTAENDVVLDPFLGRGTTAIQAALMNRIAYGSDVNPLSAILTEPRLNTPALSDVHERLKQLPARADIPEADKALTAFYHPQVLGELIAIKDWFIEREQSGNMDNIDKWIRMVAINRLTGHSTGFFSVRTLPPNQAVSVKSQQLINSKSGQVPERKNIADIILKKSKSLLRSGSVRSTRSHKIGCSNADNLSYVPTGSVSALITSPPFLNMVDYRKDNWLRCWFAGINQDTIKINTHSSINAWKGFVNKCFIDFARVVKKGGYVAFEVGEAQKGRVLLEQAVIEAVEGLPFTLISVFINQQEFTKTANCWGIANNTNGTNTNRIVLLERQ